MDDIARLGLEIRSDGVVVAGDRLKRFSAQATGTERVAASLMRTLRLLGPLFAGIGSALGISALVRYADAWSDMQSRVGAAIKDMEAAPAMMKRIVDLANASYSPLEQTVEIYGRNVSVLRDLGRNATEAADFTEALNHALVTTATKGQDADVVLNALSRSIATGRLRAMEYETIMSRSPRVLEAIADEMGVTVTGLRELASQGKVTGTVITDALINSLEKLREEAGEMPATIGDAFVRIQNNLTAFVGILDKTWGISGRVSESLLDMADNILGSVDTITRLGNIAGAVLGPAFGMLAQGVDAISAAAPVALAALAGFYAPAVFVGLATLAKAIGIGVVGAIKAVTLAMMANPLGLLIGGLAAAVTAAFMFRDEIKLAIGVDVVGVMVDTGNKTIGVFVGAYEAIKEQWSNLPTFFSAIGKMAWNSFVEAFEGPALSIDTPWGSWESGGFDLTGAKAKLTPAEEAAKGAASVAFDQGFNRNYIEGFTDSLGDLWTSATGAGDAIASLNGVLTGGGQGAVGGGLNGALAAANDNIDPLAARMRELSDVLTMTHDPFTQMMLDLTDLRTLWEEGRISVEQYEQAVIRTQLSTASAVLGVVGQLSSSLSQLFKDNKAFAVANAAINTAEGVTKALAQGGAFGFLSAAAVAAAGAAQVATILSAQPGAASRPNVGVSAPSTAANQNQAPAPVANIHLHGNANTTYTRQQVEAVLEGIADYQKDNPGVLVNIVKKAATG